MLDVEAAQEGVPEPVHLGGGQVHAGVPQPHRLGDGAAGQRRPDAQVQPIEPDPPGFVNRIGQFGSPAAVRDEHAVPPVLDHVEHSTPAGPYLVTPDEVWDAAELEVICEVDGVVMQRSRTSDLLFGPADIAAYASQIITLKPGDLIATGTPGGVGNARKPPVYLRPGNVLRTWIEGLGESRQEVLPPA